MRANQPKKKARKKKGEKISKDMILDAAQAVVMRKGFNLATIDEITTQAEISKGGVFYHFPNKETLFLELIERAYRIRREKVEAMAQSLPDTPGRWLKAFVTVWMADKQAGSSQPLNALTGLHDPILRARIKELEEELYIAVADPRVPDTIIQVVLLTCNGVIPARIMVEWSDAEDKIFRERLQAQLFAIIDQAIAPGLPA